MQMGLSNNIQIDYLSNRTKQTSGRLRNQQKSPTQFYAFWNTCEQNKADRPEKVEWTCKKKKFDSNFCFALRPSEDIFGNM